MSSVGSRTNKSFSFTRGKEFLNETDVQRLQREVDNFTRQLEQEKRRLFTVEETYMNVTKEYKDWIKKNEALKTYGNTDKKQLVVKIHSLEKQLEQAIVRYNEIVASNKLLRGDVDVIRRERVTLGEVRAQLADYYDKVEQKGSEMSRKFRYRSEIVGEMREKIVQLKEKNTDQQKIYLEEFDNLQNEIRGEKRRPASMTKGNKKQDKPENFDTQHIMRRRIQRYILNNKEKVRVIEEYQKNMKMIDEAFNIIKETSGITDIEEIMNTFIKSEEQNYSLFNYVNILTQDIDFLEENNKDLDEEIRNLRLAYEQKMILSQQTPQQEIERRKIQAVIDEKERYIRSIRDNLSGVQKPLEVVIKDINQTTFKPEKGIVVHENFILNEKTTETYLSLLEDLVVKLIPYMSQVNDNKEFATGLLLDELNIKEFDKPHNATAPNIKDISFNDESTYDQTKYMDESFIRQIAKDSVEKYHQNMSSFQNSSMNAGNTSILNKSAKQ